MMSVSSDDVGKMSDDCRMTIGLFEEMCFSGNRWNNVGFVGRR